MGRHSREMSSAPFDTPLPRGAFETVRDVAVPARHRNGRGRHAADPEPPGGSVRDPGAGWPSDSSTSWVGMAPVTVTSGAMRPAEGTFALAGVVFTAQGSSSQSRAAGMSPRRMAREAERERERAAAREWAAARDRARPRTGKSTRRQGEPEPALPARQRRSPEQFPAPACPADRPDADTMRRVLAALRRL